MPWEEKTVEKQREKFAEEAKTATNFSALCRAYGITRKTGYKWAKRYENNESLSDQSHVPHHIPNKTAESLEKLILQIRSENPEWGARTIHQILENQGYTDLPCAKTIGNILKRNEMIPPEKSAAATAYRRFEREHCNELWQTDFKGDFLLKDGTRCHPLTILDDHTRFSIMIDPKPNTLGVMESFRRAFLEYGMPLAVLSDNGWTFKGLHGGYVMFERWLMEHDILPLHGRIHHPQTQGKIERFHRTLKNECLQYAELANLDSTNTELQKWRDKYNFVRPHFAIGYKCPGEIYEKSDRIYTDKVQKYDYSGQYHVVKVNSWGYVRFANFQIFLSETMSGQYIEFRPNPHGDSFLACFRNFRIAEFDAHTGKLINRSIRRI